MKRAQRNAAMHLGFWLPLAFSTPLLIALNNPEDVPFSLPLLVGSLLVSVTLLAAATYRLGRTLDEQSERRVALVLLALALALALQGNVVHDLFYYGEFNGQKVAWRDYGWKFWLELVGFVLFPIAALRLLVGSSSVPTLVLSLPFLSCAAVLLPTVIEKTNHPVVETDSSFDASVFEFSKQRNLIHLLPDGFQGDIVREVLEDEPALAIAFSGFVLFDNHLGLYQGTAPSVPALFNGKLFGLEQGHHRERVKRDIQEHAYQNTLAAAGYRLDYVPLGTPHCVDQAETCVPRPINDLKARGYFKHRNEGRLYAIRLLADLTLFRHAPMFIKEMIYNDGNWFFSDTTADGSSPYPDPVVREWVEHMSVVDGPPRYKFYHSIGTHIPAQWDEDCNFLRDMDHTRSDYKKQTLCVLRGLATLIEQMKSKGIYDQSAFLITGDHGCNIEPYDLVNWDQSNAPRAGMNGTARPAFLVKPLGGDGPLRISHAPTSSLDVAATALDLVDLDSLPSHVSALDLPEDQTRTRIFRRYSNQGFWSGDPVPFEEYEVTGPVNDARSWRHRQSFPPREPSFASEPPPPMPESEEIHEVDSTPRKGPTLRADPNPIVVCDGSGRGQTTLSWTRAKRPSQVHIGKPDGNLFARSGTRGSFETGDWVRDGMRFYLQDVSSDKALDAAGTLATTTVRVTNVGCP